MIRGDKLVELMFLPMTDKKVVEMIDTIGLDQPVIDEKYLMNFYVNAGNFKKVGVGFRFEEIDGYTKDGEPCLMKISLNAAREIKLPFNIDIKDNYKVCCEKLGKKSDYFSDLINGIRMWIMEPINGIEYSLNILFRDDELNDIKSIIIVSFNRSNIGNTVLENKD